MSTNDDNDEQRNLTKKKALSALQRLIEDYKTGEVVGFCTIAFLADGSIDVSSDVSRVPDVCVLGALEIYKTRCLSAYFRGGTDKVVAKNLESTEDEIKKLLIETLPYGGKH